MQILLLIFIWNILHFLCTKPKVWFSKVKQHNQSVLKCLTLHEFIPVTTVSLLQNFIWYSLKFCINTLCKYRSVKLLKLQSFQFYSWFSSYIFLFLHNHEIEGVLQLCHQFVTQKVTLVSWLQLCQSLHIKKVTNLSVYTVHNESTDFP